MALTRPEQPFELSAVEPDNDFAVDHRHGCGPVTKLQKLLQRCTIFLNILVHEGNALVRKKLFLLVACPSPRLTVDNNRFSHQFSPSRVLFRC